MKACFTVGPWRLSELTSGFGRNPLVVMQLRDIRQRPAPTGSERSAPVAGIADCSTRSARQKSGHRWAFAFALGRFVTESLHAIEPVIWSILGTILQLDWMLNNAIGFTSQRFTSRKEAYEAAKRFSAPGREPELDPPNPNERGWRGWPHYHPVGADGARVGGVHFRYPG